MATPNDAALQKAAEDFKTRYTGGSVKVKAGGTVLASHPITTITIADSGSDKVVTVNVDPQYISYAGTATVVSIVSSDNLREYSMTAGEVTFNNDVFSYDEISTITNCTVTFKP